MASFILTVLLSTIIVSIKLLKQSLTATKQEAQSHFLAKIQQVLCSIILEHVNEISHCSSSCIHNNNDNDNNNNNNNKLNLFNVLRLQKYSKLIFHTLVISKVKMCIIKCKKSHKI